MSKLSVLVPVVPMCGVRIRVVYAGASYHARRTRSTSVYSRYLANMLSEMDDVNFHLTTSGNIALRNGTLFPGYDVAGIIDAIGMETERTDGIRKGTRIVLYPHDEMPHGYADYMIIPDLKYLIPIPDQLPLSVAAMLPTGAFLVMNTVQTASECLKKVLEEPNRKDKAIILVVGNGYLALWALRIAAHYLKHRTAYSDRVSITVATLNNEGSIPAEKFKEVSVVQWDESGYEHQLIERTMEACGGPVDVVLNFGTTSRSLRRSLRCLAVGGAVLLTKNAGDRLLSNFATKAKDMKVDIFVVNNGSIEQLKELVLYVSRGDIEPPSHSVFLPAEAEEVVRKLENSEINGRAILKFQNVD